MTTSAVAGLCRLTFRAPGTTFALAVPADVPLADLMPTVIGYAGADLEEEGLDHGGWVLQRLGEEPLDEERTLESLGLHDGDSVHLRPRQESLPPVHFDDLVDGVATGMLGRKDGWRPAFTHGMLLALTLVTLGAGFLGLLLPGPHPLRAMAAGATALLLLIGAAAASRAVGDISAGIALGAAAVPFLSLAGFLLPNGALGRDLLGNQLLAGASAGVCSAVLALAAVAAAAPLFLGVATVAVLGVITSVIMLLGTPMDHAVGLVGVIAVLFGSFIPALAFRLSGLRLPALPTNAEQLQEGINPHPSERVLARTDIADSYLTGFYTATALVCAGCVTVLLTSSGWAVYSLAGALSLILLLHGRAVGSAWQRLAMVGAGTYGALLIVARLVVTMSSASRLLVLVGLLLTATVLVIAAWTVPGRRLVPYWGRIADVLHTLTAISLLPLALVVFGLYHDLRAISG